MATGYLFTRIGELKMLTLTIVCLAMITFTTRYLFIHPKLPIELSARVQRFLSFSAPAVLTAIWLPIVLVQENELNMSPMSPYLLGAIVAIFFAWKTKSIYATAFAGGGVFVALSLLPNLN